MCGLPGPDRWPELLARVARRVGARSGTILSVNLHRADSYSIARMSTLFDEGQRALYEREYSHFERDHLAMVAASEPGSIDASLKVVTRTLIAGGSRSSVMCSSPPEGLSARRPTRR